jgi:hypothetical protein
MTSAFCPVAGKAGKPVPLVTPRNLVLPEHAANVEGREWFFCDQPDCDIVYFTRDGRTLDKNALKVRVGLKDKEAPRPVCYCFGHTVESIVEEIVRTGRSTVPPSIKKRVEANECSCEVLNPKGTCCLGDVNRVVKKALASVGVPRPEETQPSAATRSSRDHCCKPAAHGPQGEPRGCRPPEPALDGQ